MEDQLLKALEHLGEAAANLRAARDKLSYRDPNTSLITEGLTRLSAAEDLLLSILDPDSVAYQARR